MKFGYWLSECVPTGLAAFKSAYGFYQVGTAFVVSTVLLTSTTAAPRRATTSDPTVVHNLQMLSPGPTGVSSYNQLMGAKPYTVAIDDHDAEITPGRHTFRGVAKGMRNVAIVCPAGGKWFMTQPAADGTFSADVDVPDVVGPISVDVFAWDSAPNVYPFTVNIDERFDLFVKGQTKAADAGAPFGMQLVWSDEFNEALSATSSRHQDAKWFSGGKPSATGSQYSDAFFVSRTDKRNPFFVKSGFLRIRAVHAIPDEHPAAAWWSGHLSTGFPDESASAQLRTGYAEVRMKLPLGRGAWPAFWLMDSASTLPSKTYGAVEIDAIEAYGHDPSIYMATEHKWPGASPVDRDHVYQTNKVYRDTRSENEFHTYGVRLTETDVIWYHDREEVYRAPLYRASLVSPFYLMIDLAMGGGWPIVVPPSGYYDLWIDYVRVYQ